MNLTPKKDFQEKKQFAAAHRDLVVSTPFREAVMAAMTEYVTSMPRTNDAGEAAAQCHRMQGAGEFLTHLLNIAEVPKSIPTTPPANLDHSIR